MCTPLTRITQGGRTKLPDDRNRRKGAYQQNAGIKCPSVDFSHVPSNQGGRRANGSESEGSL